MTNNNENTKNTIRFRDVTDSDSNTNHTNQMLSTLKKRIQRLELLQQVSHELGSERNLNRLLDLILARTTQVLDADRSTLYLIDVPSDGQPHLVSKIAQGMDGIRLPLDRTSIAGTVAVSGEICNVEDPYQDKRFNPEVDRTSGYRTQSMLTCPMTSPDGTVVGVVQVLNKLDGAPFDAEDEQLLLAFSTMAAIAVENVRWLEAQKQTFEDLITGQAVAIDARDHVTGGHTWRVTAYAVEIGRTMGWQKQDLEILRYAGLLHDQGKLGISDDILLKPGRLSNWEFALMRSHAYKTKVILEGVKHLFPRRLRRAVDLAPAHHEKLDGSGYPDHLTADQIPMGARILAVADIFDALTAHRPYRSPMPDQDVIGLLRKDAEAGKLDSVPIEVLASCMDRIVTIRDEINARIKARKRNFEVVQGVLP